MRAMKHINCSARNQRQIRVVTHAYRMLSDYCEAAGQSHPGAEAAGVIAVKLCHWGAEAGVA